MSTYSPNLFNFATSELSQDAFFLWLLSWAQPNLKNIDSSLNQCALDFTSLLFNKCKKKCPHITTIKVHKQYYNIDILCIINEKYYLIIEDKTSSSDHSDQLQRYAREISVNQKIANEDILKVYLKTFDQSSYHDINKQGYTPVIRKDILDILNNCTSTNQILVDYRQYLQNIENRLKQYLTIDKESKLWFQHDTWRGLYQDIQARLLKDGLIEASSFNENEPDKIHWHNVNAPSGAFVAFFWNGFDLYDDKGVNGCAFLQLEHDKLAFKTGWAERDPRNQYRKIHEALLSLNPVKLNENEQIKLVKPARMRLSGGTATVAIIENGYLQFNEQGTIDMDKTYEVIKVAMKCMAQIQDLK